MSLMRTSKSFSKPSILRIFPALRKAIDVELVKEISNAGDELLIVQPDCVCAATQTGIVDFEAQRRDAVDLVEFFRVVEEQMLSDVAQVRVRAGVIDVHGMASGNAIVIFDFIGVRVVFGIKKKKTDARHGLFDFCFAARGNKSFSVRPSASTML